MAEGYRHCFTKLIADRSTAPAAARPNLEVARPIAAE
jgi:hypothetical protein